MTRKQVFTTTIVLGVVLLFLSGFAWAGSTELSLMAAKPHPGASGKVLMTGETLSLQAEGLRPNAVYTVWFVNSKPNKHETGAGRPPYMFKTDSEGKGAYSSSLDDSPFGKWEMIMIVLHPDGDPTDMKKMVGGLMTNIPTSN